MEPPWLTPGRLVPLERRRMDSRGQARRLPLRRDGAGVRVLTRNGHDWSTRFPTIAEAASALKARSCLIDGEAVASETVYSAHR